MDIIKDYYKWNELLRQRYEKLWPDATYHIWDGVVSPKDYANSPLKIMFLNKESFDDPDNGGYDISLGMAKEIYEGKPILGGEKNTMMLTTKNRLAVLRLLHGNLNSIDNRTLELAVNDYTIDCFREDMLKVAYCNIKKSNGVSKSGKSDLRNHFKRNKEIIVEQISFFNPTLIVGGNIVDGIIENEIEWGDNLYIADSHYINIYQIIVRGKNYPFIDMYHPSWMSLNSANNQERDWKELFQALKYVDNQHPQFWKDRCNIDCFYL